MTLLDLSRDGIILVAVSTNVVHLSTRIGTTLHGFLVDVSVPSMHPLDFDAVARIYQYFVLRVLLLLASVGHIETLASGVDFADNVVSILLVRPM